MIGGSEKTNTNSTKPPTAQLKSKLQDKRSRHHYKVSLRSTLVGHGSKRAKTGENNERETTISVKKSGSKEKCKMPVKSEEKIKFETLKSAINLEVKEMKTTQEN